MSTGTGTGKKLSALPARRLQSTFASMAQLVSTLTCPECGGVSKETMPTDSCQYFFDCRHCAALLRPLKGDCCVFCSYGDVPCPPIQAARQQGGSSSCCGN